MPHENFEREKIKILEAFHLAVERHLEDALISLKKADKDDDGKRTLSMSSQDGFRMLVGVLRNIADQMDGRPKSLPDLLKTLGVTQ